MFGSGLWILILNIGIHKIGAQFSADMMELLFQSVYIVN